MKKNLKHMILMLVMCISLMALVPVSASAASKPRVPARQGTDNYALKMMKLRDVDIYGIKPGDVIYDLKYTNKKLLTAKIYCYDNTYHITMVPKKLGRYGTSKLSFKIRRGKKSWSYNTTITFYKYSNPAKLVKLGNKTITSAFNKSGIAYSYKIKKKFSGVVKAAPKPGWELKNIKHYSAKGKATTKKNGSRVTIGKGQSLWITFYKASIGAEESLGITYD